MALWFFAGKHLLLRDIGGPGYRYECAIDIKSMLYAGKPLLSRFNEYAWLEPSEL